MWLVCADNFENMSLIMTFHVDVTPEYISLFFEIARSLEMFRWVLPRISFIVTFLL